MAGPPHRALRFLSAVLAVGLLAAACGGGGAASPSPRPAAPRPTPNPHLREPARAETIYSTLIARGLQLIGTNASRGRDPAAVINATYAGWPLVLAEYRSSASRRRLEPIAPGRPPGPGDPPFAFAGLNLVIVWGPRLERRTPGPPPAAYVAAAVRIAAELDRLIGPLAERSSRPVAPRPKKAP